MPLLIQMKTQLNYQKVCLSLAFTGVADGQKLPLCAIIPRVRAIESNGICWMWILNKKNIWWKCSTIIFGKNIFYHIKSERDLKVFY